MTATATKELWPTDRRERQTTRKRDTILLALADGERPTRALLEAAAIAEALPADLHVVRVLPEFVHLNPLTPERNALEALRQVERSMNSVRATAAWLTAELGAGEAARCFSILHGDFIEQITRCANELDATMIVIPPREGRIGNLATSLACAANLPVLTARGDGCVDRVVAATDLESGEYPVLWTAAELACGLDASLVALHNVTTSNNDAWPRTQSTAPIDDHRWATELREISGRLPVEAEPVVRREVDAVEAILEEAQANDADLVVVGTRRRSWFERLVTRTVASRVVNRAKRSVLVTPIDAAEEIPPAFVGS